MSKVLKSSVFLSFGQERKIFFDLNVKILLSE